MVKALEKRILLFIYDFATTISNGSHDASCLGVGVVLEAFKIDTFRVIPNFNSLLVVLKGS